MKRIYILMFVLLVTGFVRGDAGVPRPQDPLVVNSKSIALKLENSRVRVLEATLDHLDRLYFAAAIKLTKTFTSR